VTGRDVVLEVENLRTEFRLRSGTVGAVDGVSFTVQAGECVGLVGESGCGKSTTGLSIMKLLPNVGHVVGGSIRLLGRDLGPLSEREMTQVRGNDVAMIFQDPMTSLNPTWTIGKQIAEAYQLHHRDASQREALARAREVLELVRLPRPAERLNAYPHQLSGGLRQRVMIAMALVNSPKLLIADEPTTALDVTIQAQILDLIDGLRRDFEMAVILITHDLGVIAARANRVMVMYAGKIAEGAGTEELFGSMRHPYTEALFRSIPRFDQDRTQALFSIPGIPPDLMFPPPGCRFASRCRNAQKRCTEEEPLLAPDTGNGGSRPGAGTEHTETPTVPGAIRAGEHVFACFYPVDVSASDQSTLQELEEEASPLTLGLVDANAGVDTGQPISLVERSPSRIESPNGREVLVRLEDIHKEFPVTAGAVMQRRVGTVKAVSGVSFDVHSGETFGLVGESGCGKTTIGWLVTALHRPSSGEIRFGGQDIGSLGKRALRRARRDLQLMFQDPYASLDPRMRVGPTIREPLNIQRVGSSNERDKRVAELLTEVGLSPKAAGLYPHEFSGGQRQRIGLARALALNPKLIVADEPVSALDVSIQAQILNLMRGLQAAHDLTYIVISHDLAVVRYLADTIGVMYLGKLVEIGPATEVYERPAHPYTRGLIDAVPIPDPVLERQRDTVPVRGELPSAMDPPSGCRFRTRCPLAQDVCAEVEPPLRSFGRGHRAACHFPLETPEESTDQALVGA
jgi:oligopeptide/dipeptide ABC transporter ATP-binding protein